MQSLKTDIAPDHRHPRLAISYIPISELRIDPSNAREHPKRQVKLLAQSIAALGFNVPLLVDGDRNLLAGHGRLLAARQLGMTVIPVVRLDHLSPEQAQAFRIADNRLTEIATWDDALLAEQLKALAAADLEFSIEATGFTVGEIDMRIEGLDANGPVDVADEMPVLQRIPVSRTKDIWLLGEHRVLCASAVEDASYEALMENHRAAMVFADPPYNIPIDGFVSGKGAIRHREFAMAVGEMSPAQFEHFLATTIGHLVQYSQDGSLHYLCMDWRHATELLLAGKRWYSEIKNICVWVKDRAGMGSLYRAQHEFIFVFKSGTAAHRNNIELGRNGRHRTNVWKYPSIVNERRGDEGDLLALHPTVKPVRLIADAILDACAPRDIVLDAFLGSGSTLIAAHRVGRVCFGIEIDPLYVDTAIRRWQADTGEQAVHAATGQTFTQREEAAGRNGGDHDSR